MLKARVLVLLSFLAVVVIAATASATPLSVSIFDHDFTFDVPYISGANTNATYDFNGALADHLGIHNASGHYVSSYTYTGVFGTVPASSYGTPPVPSPDPYPLYSGTKFGANLSMDMYFSHNDGPYVDPNTGDRYDISLTGNSGHIVITGRVYSQDDPPAVLYPNPKQDIILLDITLSQVSLLARAGSSVLDLVEGYGTVNTFMGQPMSETDAQGVTFFRFWSPVGQAIFPVLPTSLYDPLTDYSRAGVQGSMSGEIGGVPEPLTLAMLALGVPAMLIRRRKAR